MAKSLEGMYKKSLDANVERDGSKEIDWDKDDDSFTIADIDFDDDIDTKIFESDAIEKGILESQEWEDYERLHFGNIAEEHEVVEIPDYLDQSLSDLETERAKLEAELIAVHGESKELKEKIAALEKRLEIAREADQRMREAVMELEGIF